MTKRYWRGATPTVVLDGLSLDVDAGELTLVWGDRGAGKSTLLRIASGAEAPDSGTVAIEGRDLASLSRNALADLLQTDVGLIERRGPLLPDLPILDYVALPLLATQSRLKAHERAALALRRAGVPQVGALTWSQLSNGDRALVAVAHAVARGPKLLLADDPTGALNAVERERVMALLSSAARDGGLGVLMVTPDAPLGSHARILALSDGRMIGPPQPSGQVVDLGARRPPPLG